MDALATTVLWYYAKSCYTYVQNTIFVIAGLLILILKNNVNKVILHCKLIDISFFFLFFKVNKDTILCRGAQLYTQTSTRCLVLR